MASDTTETRPAGRIRTRIEDPLHDLLEQLEDAGRQVGDRLGDLLDDLDIKERLEAIGRAVGDLRDELSRRIHGEPASPPLDEMTVDELRRLASEREIPGRSKMNKAQLLDALRSS